jgi:hypothetical protein
MISNSIIYNFVIIRFGLNDLQGGTYNIWT